MALLIHDDVTAALEPRFEKAAALVKDALLTGRPVWVRFDRDADGTSGGLLFSAAIKAFKKDHPQAASTPVRLVSGEGAIYTAELYAVDHSQLQFLEKKPVIVFVDHSGNPDSVPQLDKLRKEGCTVIVADHHPVPIEVFSAAHMDVACDPYSLPGMDRKGSNYTGGLLSFEITRRIHPIVEQAPYSEIPFWSLQADKSKFARPNVELKEPTVIDYFCTSIDSPTMLPQVEERIFDANEVNRIFDKAMRAVDETALEALGQHVTEETLKSGLVLCSLNMEFKKHAWPSKSRLMNAVSTALFVANGKRPAVLIGYAGDKVSFRANQEALDHGFKSNDFIQPAKKDADLGPLIISGGGHDAAAAMAVTENKARHVAKALMNQIKAKFDR